MPSDLVRFESVSRESSARRSVLFVTNMWADERRPYYGSFIASQARSLARAGVNVDVIYVRGFLGPHAYLRALVDVPRLGRRARYDVVHIHYGHTAFVSLGLCRRPVVISFCGEDLLGAPRERGLTYKSRVEVAVFRQVARTATVTITKSSEMEDVLPADLRERNYVLPNGVDLDVFAPMPQEQARTQLGWPRDEKVILFLGNPDDPRKNVSLAHQAAELVRKEIPAARLHIAWGVRPDEVPTLMNAADCLVFPSRSEGSPNAVKEAMACALPIVATPVGDIIERLSGVEGCFVRDASATAFAPALIEAVRRGRVPAARRAIENLDIGAVAGRLTAIYDDAAQRHFGAGPEGAGA
jgi:glycosyltransferase involved in cell wall biosynthesis